MQSFWNWLRSLFTRPAVISPVIEPPKSPIYEPPVVAPKPVPEIRTGRVLVIDVARYQEGIYWAKVAQAGIKAVIIKATDGDSGVDPFFTLFRRQAKEHGLIVGCYHFGRFWADPIKQAEHFLQVTGGVLPGELPLSMDYEWDNSPKSKEIFKGKYSDGGQADAFSDAHVLKSLSYLKEKTGIKPIIYTAPGFFTGHSNGAFLSYHLWLNDFHAKEEKEMRVPKPWTQPLIWQYAEKPGYGVTGVDYNYFLGSFEQLKALVKK